MRFLVTCRDTGVNKNHDKFKNKFYHKILLDEISKKKKSIKLMKKDFKMAMENLLTSTTFFKELLSKMSINRSVIKEEKIVLNRHPKKLNNLL